MFLCTKYIFVLGKYVLCYTYYHDNVFEHVESILIHFIRVFYFSVNSYICYKSCYIVQKKMDHVKFQHSVVNGLIGTYRDGNTRRGRKSAIIAPLVDPINQHSLDIIPDGGRRQCAVCFSRQSGSYRKSRINTWCAACGVGLCIGRCFRNFHNINEE